jgi:TM2 domain-containing membrane protein YozV
MRRSTKAVLLSALVLPGAGQFYLKHFARGIALVTVSLVCLGFIVDGAIQQATAVLAQLESGTVTPDVAHITDLVNQASNSSAGTAVTLATWVMAGCWLAGVVDAYRLGQRQDARKAA